jgi:hypothetical protein
MRKSARMVIDDPSKFHLVSDDLKELLIEGGKNTLNVEAAVARKEAKKNIQTNFTNRNAFTANQAGFTPVASGFHSLAEMQSFVGISEKAPWMKRQEEGGLHTPSRGSTLDIPTYRARGGSNRNPVTKNLRIKIGRRKRVHGKPRSFKRRLKSGKVITVKAKSYVSIKAERVARAGLAFNKKLFVFIGDQNGGKSLFKVSTFVKKGKKGVAFQLELFHKFDTAQTKTEANPWLLPASEKVGRQVQAIFNSQMKKLGV